MHFAVNCDRGNLPLGADGWLTRSPPV